MGLWPAMIAVLLACTIFPVSSGAQSEDVSEYQVKAAFLYNFAKFVDWPSDAFVSDTAPINLCVIGQDPFGDALDDAVRDKSIGRHKLVIRRTKKLDDEKACQIIFLSDSESKRLPEVLRSVSGASTLLVGERQAFAEQGGVIAFLLEDNKVRFAINVDAAERARLKISSKLLALATIVHDPAPGKRN
ncbi:MAG: YfiR family protein [Candidatus Acidiferrales bacterium]